MGHIKKENLLLTQLPIPKDLSKLKKQLSSLQMLHQQITSNTELIPQKEKTICNLIKKLSDEGKEGVDYDKYKLGDICEVNPSNNKIISEYINYLDITGCINFETHKLKNNKELPLRAKRTPLINDVLLSTVRPKNKNITIIKKYNYVENLLASTGFALIRSKNINPNYIYYYVIQDNITDYLSNKADGSGYPAVNTKDIVNMYINVPKPSIMNKYKLQELFDEVDNMKETLENNKKEYQKQLEKLFESFQQNTN